jgi:hypothetical protein
LFARTKRQHNPQFRHLGFLLIIFSIMSRAKETVVVMTCDDSGPIDSDNSGGILMKTGGRTVVVNPKDPQDSMDALRVCVRFVLKQDGNADLLFECWVEDRGRPQEQGLEDGVLHWTIAKPVSRCLCIVRDLDK